MKAKIHPKYEECTITCTCGNVIKTQSTKKEIDIAICGKCHPFYTGQQKFVDTAGRIEKFQKRFQISDGQGTEAVVQKKKVKSKKQILAEARAKERAEKQKRLVKETKSAERKAKKEKGEGKGADKGGKAEKKEAKPAKKADAKAEKKDAKPAKEEKADK